MTQPTQPKQPNQLTRRILLIEDDPAIADTLNFAFGRESWEVVWCSTGAQAQEQFSQHFDCMVLDVGLPDTSGFELCKQVRAHTRTPLVFLTARSEEIDKIVGLEIGADDYCTKPFSPREVVARIKAIWRRTEAAALSPAAGPSKNISPNPSTSPSASASLSSKPNRGDSVPAAHQQLTSQNSDSITSNSNSSPSTNGLQVKQPNSSDAAGSGGHFAQEATLNPSDLNLGYFFFDSARYELRYGDQLLALTPFELRLLLGFMRAPNRVLSREQLMTLASNHPEHALARTVDSHIKTLRQKIALAAKGSELPAQPIKTHRGLGYLLDMP